MGTYDAIPIRSGLESLARAIEKSSQTADERLALANAIENGLLSLAESIKYATDCYIEMKQTRPRRGLTNIQPDYLPFLENNDLTEINWRPARVGDIICPTGLGLGSRDYSKWCDCNRIARVTQVRDNGVYWEDVLTNEKSGGCLNEQGRFAIYDVAF